MKKFLSFFLIIFLQQLVAQNTKTIVSSYLYENRGANEVYNADTYIKGSESLTIFKEIDSLSSKKGVTRDDDGNYIVNRSKGYDEFGKRVYKNLAKGKIIFRDVYSVDGKFKYCIVNEKLPIFQWKLSTETKKIGKHLCKLAKLHFRGRNYIVWYAEEIPISHGPWKFYGLPGIIIEITSEDNNIHFLLKSIQELELATSNIIPPSQGAKITFERFVQSRNNSVSDFMKRLTAKLPRGATVELKSSVNNSIETKFND